MSYFRKMEELIFAIKEAKRRNCNINLLIGAGCSVTAGIPLANKIIEELTEKYPFEMCRIRQETYAECMSKLTHIERRLFIADYVKNAKVNWAHICIALLMKENYINRVLTTNFDNLLPRACAMVGEFPGIYDLALTKTTKFRSDLLLDNSIIYLHGQYSGFILCNTDDEVKSQKENIEPIFKELNKNSLWIIAGYSGNNDAIFQLFTEVKPFENRLYWVGYKENDPSDLIKENLLSSRDYAFYIKGYDADSFFIHLARHFGLFPPKFVKEPFTYTKDIFNQIEVNKSSSLEETHNSENLMHYTYSILDEAIYEIESDVKMVAKLYVNNLKYYVDEFQELISNNYEQLKDILNILNEVMDRKVNECEEQVNKHIIEIDKIIESDSLDINIIQMAIRILENIYIAMMRENSSNKKDYLISTKKYFDAGIKIDSNNTELIYLIAKIFNKYYDDSSNKEDDIGYLIQSFNYFVQLLTLTYSSEIMDGVIDVIQNIVNSSLVIDEKVSKIEELIGVIDKNNIIINKDKDILTSAIDVARASLSDGDNEKIKILNSATDKIEQLYKQDKSNLQFLKLLIDLNSKLINITKDKHQYKEIYSDKINNSISLLKTLKNFYPLNIVYLINYNNLLIDKLPIIEKTEGYLDNKLDLVKAIMENIKNIVDIGCKDNNFRNYRYKMIDSFSSIFYSDNLEITLIEYIKSEYYIYIENKINSNSDERYIQNLLEFNNEICFLLIDNTEYMKSTLERHIFDFTENIIDLILKDRSHKYLIATKGLWYLKNTFTDSLKSEEEGYKLYENAITLCDTNDEKNGFTQKMYLELAKFSIHRLQNCEQAMIYCRKGIELGENKINSSVYDELIELDGLLSFENVAATSDN